MLPGRWPPHRNTNNHATRLAEEDGVVLQAAFSPQSVFLLYHHWRKLDEVRGVELDREFQSFLFCPLYGCICPRAWHLGRKAAVGNPTIHTIMLVTNRRVEGPVQSAVKIAQNITVTRFSPEHQEITDKITDRFEGDG